MGNNYLLEWRSGLSSGACMLSKIIFTLFKEKSGNATSNIYYCGFFSVRYRIKILTFILLYPWLSLSLKKDNFQDTDFAPSHNTSS